MILQHEAPEFAEFGISWCPVGSSSLWLHGNREDGYAHESFLEWGNPLEHSIGCDGGWIRAGVVMLDDEVSSDCIPNRSN